MFAEISNATLFATTLAAMSCNTVVPVHDASDLDVEVQRTNSPLTKIEVTGSLEGEIGDGGFDTQISAGSGRFFFPDRLNPCGHRVIEWATSWASTHDLLTLKLKSSKERAVLHAEAPDRSGFFRFYYSLANDASTADGEISFHDNQGKELSLSTDRFPALELKKLPAQMLERMKCE